VGTNSRPAGVPVDHERIQAAVRELLLAVGEDPDREGLRETPDRVARMCAELFAGLHQDPRELLQKTFTQKYDEMVLVKDIDFYSLCEHHLVPFFGKAHVAYIPDRKILGLSKLARLVEVYSRRLQVQERLTTQIANMLMDQLDPLGVAVVLEAEHLCMRMRGVEKQNSIIVTSAMLGAFRSQQETRQEFMTLITNGGRR
jgi:GTP cyclohydrolase I